MKWWVAGALALAFACGDSAGDDDDDAVAFDAAPEPNGCEVASPPTGVQTRSIAVRGVDRSYELSVPDDYDSAREYALVFGWHGLGSNGAVARTYFGVEQSAAGDAIVVYADGLEQANLGGETGWNFFTDSDDIGLFDALVWEVSDEYCIDSARIYATGHSNGAYFTNALACQRSARLAAIAPVAGGGPVGVCDGGAMPALLIHGVNDSVVSVSMGRGSRAFWIDNNGCEETSSPADPAPCEAYDGCASAPVIWCEHADTVFNGHGWPDFAADAIWSFFEAR